jgi:hypothetical protein
MAAPTGNFVLDKGFRLLSGQTMTKFRAVKLASAGVCTNVAAVGDPAIGISQFSVSAAELLRGKGVPVRLEGISELEVAGPVAVGDEVAMAADGRGKGAAPAAGDRILGIALTAAAGNAGDRVSVQLTPGRIFTAGS